MQERLRAAERYVCNGVCVNATWKFNVYRPVLKQLINSAMNGVLCVIMESFHNLEGKTVRK